MFHRLGRAMLRPLFKQSHSYATRCSSDVDAALEWWEDVLRFNLAQERGFAQAPAAPAWLFVDARSTPARIAAVLVTDGRAWYSDVEPPERFLRHFRPRGDGQITSLELLSMAFALCTFS